jgi:hypothetical protein
MSDLPASLAGLEVLIDSEVKVIDLEHGRALVAIYGEIDGHRWLISEHWWRPAPPGGGQPVPELKETA